MVYFSFESNCLDRAFELAMQFDSDRANLREVQVCSIELPTGSVWIGEAVVARTPLKSGIARVLSILTASEEVLKGFVQAV